MKIKSHLNPNSMIWWFAVLAVSMASLGCDTATVKEPTTEDRAAIEGVAKWFQYFRTKHRGKAPKDEAEFAEFIEKIVSERNDDVTVDQILTSPRDGKKFIVQYGKAAGKSRNLDENVACYEQEGSGGRKLVAFEAAWGKEVDEVELQSLLAGEE